MFKFIEFEAELPCNGRNHHGDGMPTDDTHREDRSHPDSLTSYVGYSDGTFHLEFHPHSAYQHTKLGGQTFMDGFDADVFAEERSVNIFYPFASKYDWELASWLYNSRLSMAEIDKFLSLQIVSLLKIGLLVYS